MIRYHARWIVPVTAAPIRDGTLIEDDGRIAYVGPRAGAPAGEDRDLGNVIMLPGLVNVHAHLDLSVMRGFLEDLPFGDWIRMLRRAKQSVLGEASLLDAARLSLLEALRAGITAVGDTSDSGVALRAMGELGMRGISFQEVFGPDPAQCERAMQGLREKIARLREHETPGTRAGISPHAPYSVSDDLFSAAARYAMDEGLPMAIHIAESTDEMRYVAEARGDFAESQRERGFPLRPRGRTPVEMLARLGVLDARPLLIHCVQVDAADIEMIARSGSTVAHCPAANAKLGHGIAPVADMCRAGVRVALGSDSVASNNRMDMLEEARLAVLMQRARACEPTCLTAAEALEMATLGGAKVLGLEKEIGSLEAGKSADFAAFALDAPHAVPLTDPIAAAVFSLAGRDAACVAIRGALKVEKGSLMAETAGISARVQATAERLADWRRAPAEQADGAT